MMVLGRKVAIFDWEWGRISAPREGEKIPWPMFDYLESFFIVSDGSESIYQQIWL